VIAETANFLGRIGALPAVPAGSVEGVRARRRLLATLFDEGPSEVDCVEGTIAGVPTRTYGAPGVRESGTVVYAHGGGWVAGDLVTHDGVCRHLARASGLRVVSVGYRQPPEHRHPAAVDDAEAVAASFDDTAHGGTIVLAGDSSGAHVAFEVAERRRGLRTAGLALIQPACDPRLREPSWQSFGEGYFLTTAAMRWYWDTYLGASASTSLAERDTSGLPPTYIVTSDLDPSADEAKLLGEALRSSGQQVTMDSLSGVPHGCLTLPGAFPSQVVALERIARWMSDRVHQQLSHLN
jgi:acetyl esterase